MPPEEPQQEESEQRASDLASIDLENGELVVYDPDNHRAWLQSDAAVELDEQS